MYNIWCVYCMYVCSDLCGNFTFVSTDVYFLRETRASPLMIVWAASSTRRE